MDRGLVWLALRRTLSPGVLGLFVLLALVLVRRDWAGETARLAADGAGVLERGLARAGVWLGLSVVVAAACLGRAAGSVGRWRAGEADWLAPRALSRTGAVLSTWMGIVLAGLALLLATAICAELAARGAPPSFASGGAFEGRGVQRLDGGARVRLELEDPGVRGSGARLALELGLRLDSGVESELALRVRRLESAPGAQPGPWNEVRRHLGAAARVEVELPPGSGPLEIELERLGAGALLALAPRAELWLPVASEAVGSARLAFQGGIALAALTALVLGLAAWTRPAIGAALLAALALAVLLSGAGPLALAPGSGWPAALDVLQQGRVPRGQGPLELAGAVLVACLGLGLAAWGCSPWRRAA